MTSFLKYFSFFLPLFWLFGLDQIILYIISIFALFLISVKCKKLYRPSVWLLIFITSSIISMIFIDDNIRYLEAIRNIIIYFSIFSIIYYYYDKNIYLQKLLLYYHLIFIIWITIAGYLGYFINISFIAPSKMIIPITTNSSFINSIFSKNLGGHYFTIIGDLWRPSSFFAHSTSLGITLSISLPLILLYKQNYIKNSINRMLVNILILFVIGLIILTTTRIAIISIIFLMFYLLIKRKKYITIVSLVSSLIIIISKLLNQILTFRGGGSTGFRMELYKKSINYFLERPIFGWGAQMDLKGFESIPALGSHSYYLNILFSTGIIGFILFYIFLFSFIFLLYHPNQIL